MQLFAAKGDFGGIGRKKLNSYNLWMIFFVSLGSFTNGYTANVISATLGRWMLTRLHNED